MREKLPTAFTSNYYTYAVKDIPIGEDPHIQIRLDNIIKLCFLLIPEKSVRHPHLGPFCHGQVFHFSTHITKCKSIVILLLSKSNLNAELKFLSSLNCEQTKTYVDKSKHKVYITNNKGELPSLTLYHFELTNYDSFNF